MGKIFRRQITFSRNIWGTEIENFDDSLNAFTDYEGHMSAGQAEAFSVQLVEDFL